MMRACLAAILIVLLAAMPARAKGVPIPPDYIDWNAGARCTSILGGWDAQDRWGMGPNLWTPRKQKECEHAIEGSEEQFYRWVKKNVSIPIRGDRCAADDWWKQCRERTPPNDKRPVECFSIAIRDVPSAGPDEYVPFLAKRGDTFIVTQNNSKTVGSHGGYELPRNAIRFLTACPRD